MVGACRADSGSYGEKAVAKFCAQRFDFVGGADEAVASGVESDGGESDHLIEHGVADAGLAEVEGVHAGEDGDSKDEGLVLCAGGDVGAGGDARTSKIIVWGDSFKIVLCAGEDARTSTILFVRAEDVRTGGDGISKFIRFPGGLNGGTEHLPSAAGVDGQHADAELGSLADGCGHSVGDVVILEIEKNLFAGGNEVANNLRTCGGVELHSDFVGPDGISEGRNNSLCLSCRGDIERDNEPLTGNHVGSVYSGS